MPFARYNAQWPDEYKQNPLGLELACIRKGGKWTTKAGIQCGEGLPHHFEECRKMLWPRLDDHRWHRLCRDEILRNKIIVLMGPASSAKTHEAAWIHLVEYYAFPDETCVLVSSTDLRGLELRVWGEIKSLHDEAKTQFPWLAGNLIDSKHCIATDDIEEDGARNLRKGIIGIPCIQGGKFVGLGKYCFPAGTMVDTPTGKKAIENIRENDVVFSAIGPNRVRCVGARTADALVRITLSTGSQIDCTPEHPFLTSNGWVNAIDISPQSVVYSHHETMQIMREGCSNEAGTGEILFSGMPKENVGENLRSMRNSVYSEGSSGNFLYKELWCEVENDPARHREEDDRWKKHSGNGQENQSFNNVQRQRANEPFEKGVENFQAVARKTESSGMPSLGKLRSGAFKNTIGKENGSDLSRSDRGFCGENWFVLKTGACSLLRFGLRLARHIAFSGSRRFISPQRTAKEKRHCPGLVLESTRVDRVEVLSRTGDERYCESNGGYTVYNLEVAGHPSFSVEGVIAHNCGIKQKRMRLLGDELQFMNVVFISAISNLDKNVDFRATLLGNPTEILDCLGKCAEPKDGWQFHMDHEKTAVWDTRFMNGRCINLIGTDSPNFDFPQDQPTKYPYLISREKIENTASFWGKDTVEYMSQCIGKMRVATMARRVISRDLCVQFAAMDEVVWEGTPLTKIGALDAAYGGDRCVAGYVEFGKDVTGKTIVLIHPPVIVPIRVVKDVSPEDQIAAWVKDYCESMDVPPENFYHDSTGRGSLGTALARVWSAQCNPVEFGGMPTTRPVCLDMFTIDKKTGERRLKLCNEHYSKFVTELWFSVRYTIEGGQMRGLPEDVMDEGCMREWHKVAGDRIEIEPKSGTANKPGMKERTGRSPDLFDWLAIAIEGCRRKGFDIARLARDVVASTTDDFFDTEAKRYAAAIKSRRLQQETP